MTNSNNHELYADIMSQISPDSIRSSIDMLRLFASKGASPSIVAQIDELEQRYFYMLRFIASGNSVPKLAMELKVMSETARNICTEIERERVAREEQTLYSAQLRYQSLRPEENLQSLISDYIAELERLRTDSASLTDSRRSAKLEQMASDIFMRIWVQMPMTCEDNELLMSIFEDSEIPEYDRELWLGAVGLGMLSYEDSNRKSLLCDVMARCLEPLSPIASVWLVLAYVSCFNPDSPDDSIPDHIFPFYPDDIPDAWIELFRACGTKEISDDFARDVLPGMMDIGRKMADKFGNEPEKIEEAMRNGEWDGGLDTDGFEKIKGFIEAQNRGDDVYMATLGKMRQFPFFNNIPNWFLPFYAGHSALADVTDGEGLAFADTVGKMPFLCDSDKYAMLLSVASTPAALRENLLRNIVDQQNAMNGEMLDAALAEMKSQGRRAVMSRYIKNLYRFFSLFRRKSEFPNVFNVEALYEALPGGRFMDERDDKLLQIADLLLRLRYYPQAASVFGKLSSRHQENVQYLQKQGYAYELVGELDDAVMAYSCALDLKPDDMWTIRRMASVYSDLCIYNGVLDLLEPLQAEISEDAELLNFYAEASWETGDYARALELYYNITYLLGDDTVKPELAWMLVLNGDFDGAGSAFADIIDKSTDPLDYIHLGHLHWAKNEIPAALDAYTKAAGLVEPQKISFAELFADTYSEISFVLTQPQKASLRTVPDIIAFRTYGSRFGKL